VQHARNIFNVMIKGYRLFIYFFIIMLGWIEAPDILEAATLTEPKNGIFHVYQGQSIQAALDLAANHTKSKVVRVHEGTYRPTKKAQSFIVFNHQHDGIKLQAEGDVILTAANPDLADPKAESFPAIVNHVVYFGDGISNATLLEGFKITGSNHFVTDSPMDSPMEPSFEALKKTEGFYGALFFYTDGGGIKIFGRSYPVIDTVEIYDCYSSPCGAGISIEHRGLNQKPVLLKNCIFRNNQSLVTGSAVDLLPKSAAFIQNCLFVGNISNTGLEYKHYKGNINWPEIPKLMATTVNYQPERGSGALTVFFGSRIQVEQSTFTGNFNGVDDRASQGVYRNCIFWKNDAEGGLRSGKRFELDILQGKWVTGCMLGGTLADPNGSILNEKNVIDCVDPNFNEHFVPQNPAFNKAGYRPVP
jgi:hypothetical protein